MMEMVMISPSDITCASDCDEVMSHEELLEAHLLESRAFLSLLMQSKVVSDETIFMLGFWTQRRILMSKWLRHRVYLLPFLALLASVCVVVLVPAFVDTEATSSERFSPAGDLTTYGYS